MRADSTISRTTDRSTGKLFAPSGGIMIAALLAILTLHSFRLPGAMYAPLVWIELVTFLSIPLIALLVLKSRFGDLDANPISMSSIYGFQVGAVIVCGLVLLWHQIARSFGFGDANEIVALVLIQSIAWYLAVFSQVPGFERTSAVLSGGLVFFVGCMSENIGVFAFAGLFAVAVLWWLLGQYWRRMADKTIGGQSHMLRINGAAIGGTAVVVAVVAFLVGLIPLTNMGLTFDGFMPFSGGRDGMQDRFARSGIGNGDLIRAGRNATTTGAVDSDNFIEGHRPSMYDVTSERYDGPILKKKRSHRTVALEKAAKHLHDAKQSEQSGRSFRTMRESNRPSELKMEERITKALFFVEGSVPARFVNNTFHHFDGWDWSSQPLSDPVKKMPKIRLGKRSGIPVFDIARVASDYLTGRRMHRVKVMRLETSTLPASSLLTAWHMDHVEQLDLFRWSDAGLIRMDGEFIPPHAVIDVESFAPNYHVMRSGSEIDLAWGTDAQKETLAARFLQLPENTTDETIDRLVDRWTSGLQPGWSQVEAIVERMRNDFEFNPDWKRDDQVDDTVGHFFEQNGGPSYMFATTCTLALRKAGYQTRMTSGFLVREKDYDWKSKQSVVTSENLHMWPEVCLDGKFWIPVEPTPGYPIPYSEQTAWQWVTAKALMAWKWIWKHTLTSAFCIATLVASVLLRAEIITLLMLFWWYVVKFFWPQGLLKATRQLIDLRFSVAGDRRPSSTTISNWYRRVEPDLPADFFDLWNANNFSDSFPSVAKSNLVSTCGEPLSVLTLKRIREFISTRKKAYAV